MTAPSPGAARIVVIRPRPSVRAATSNGPTPTEHDMTAQQPILSAPGEAEALDIGGARLVRRIASDQTGGDFAVVEFHADPGQGVGLHVHEREDELVYLLEGRIEVALGDQTMTVPAGACALLPRGIPHGFTNTGDAPSRLLAVLLPGALDGFFKRLHDEIATDRAHEEAIARLCAAYGLRFLAEAGA